MSYYVPTIFAGTFYKWGCNSLLTGVKHSKRQTFKKSKVSKFLYFFLIYQKKCNSTDGGDPYAKQ